MAIEPEEVVYQLAMADTAVTALIGARMYPDQAPQGVTVPYVTYSLIDSPRYHSLAGPAGMGTARVQVDTYANGKPAVNAIKEAMRLCLSGWSGTQSSRRCSILLDSDNSGFVDQPDAGPKAGNLALRRASQDYMVVFDEAIPTH